MPDFVSDIDAGPGTSTLESGDILEMPDFVSDFEPGPGEPLLESGVGLDMPHFASDCDMQRIWDLDQ